MDDFALRALRPSKNILGVLILVCSVAPAVISGDRASEATRETAKVLGDHVASFHSDGPAISEASDTPGALEPAFRVTIRASRTYTSDDGRRLAVQLTLAESDAAAYSELTYKMRSHMIAYDKADLRVGTLSYATTSAVSFVRGPAFVTVSVLDKSKATIDDARALARSLATKLDVGESDIPVLVKHLPDWENAQQRATYAVSLDVLKALVPSQSTPGSGPPVDPRMPSTSNPMLNAISFEGGTEAVTATYGPSQLVIVEFTTPQFASDNDRRIVAKIQELKSQGQSVPTAYRRVGNYSVFVFNAPDEKTANELIDQVKYEQVVQWLGDDPFLYERIERYLAQKTAGVVVAVLEGSGLSVLLCLGVGGLFGALLFRRRRARQRGAEGYSDAGGMIRLNLDDVTDGSDASGLLQGSNKDG